MAKNQYRLNSEKLIYEKIIPSRKVQMLKIFGAFILLTALSIGMRFAYGELYPGIKQLLLQHENERLLQQYDIIKHDIKELEVVLADIQKRDDYLYRTIVEADPIPVSMREAGIGGVDKYRGLQGFEASDIMLSANEELDKIKGKLYIQSQSFDDVADWVVNHKNRMMSVPAIQPIFNRDLYRVSDYFGYRTDPFTNNKKFHEGIDYAGLIGVPVHSTGKGKVLNVLRLRYGYGNVIIIDHGFGYKTRYGHLNSINVKVGDEVVRGQLIGTLGTSGRSTGPHLHYEVIFNNRKVDPLNTYVKIPDEEYDGMVSSLNSRE